MASVAVPMISSKNPQIYCFHLCWRPVQQDASCSLSAVIIIMLSRHQHSSALHRTSHSAAHIDQMRLMQAASVDAGIEF